MAHYCPGCGEPNPNPHTGEDHHRRGALLRSASCLGLLPGADVNGGRISFEPHEASYGASEHGPLVFIDDPWMHIDPDTREYFLAMLEGREPKYLDRSARARRRMDEESKRRG